MTIRHAGYETPPYYGYDMCRPWEGTGEIPINWFREHFDEFVYPAERIAAEASPYHVGLDIPDGGIYFCLNDGVIDYVGISFQIENRLLQHYASKRFPFSDYWCLVGIPGIFAEHIETFYIHALQPQYNSKYKRPEGIVRERLDGLRAA